VNIDEVVKTYLPSAPEERIESGTTRVLHELRTRPLRVVDEFVEGRIPAVPSRPFRLAWAGVAMAALLASVLLWHQGPPFSAVFRSASDHSSRLSSEQAGEILPVTVPQDAFDLASVKLLSPSSEAAKNARAVEAYGAALMGCSGGTVPTARIDPGRLTISASSIAGLIVTAYGQDCTVVEGGPAWSRSGEYYEINALLPGGTPSYTVQDLYNGKAPALQRMLQNLLANRFRLVITRQFREMPVYALTVAKPGKMKLSPEEVLPAPASFPTFGRTAVLLSRGQFVNAWAASMTSGPTEQTEVQMAAHAISMSDLAKNLRQHSALRVVDKTGLNDLFDVELKFASEVTVPRPQGFTPPARTSQTVPPVPVPLPSLRTALGELGLKLEPTRLPVEVLIVQSVERPAEN
jgi:uncharacterized protein (TIGR03435 family)